MTNLPQMTAGASLLLVLTVLGAIAAQNITNTTNVTADITMTVTTVTANTNDASTLPVEITATSKPESMMLEEFLVSTEKPPDVSPSTENTTTVAPKVEHYPSNCSLGYREKLPIQPQQSPASRLRKCCPNGETLVIGADSSQCETQEKEFAPQVIKVELYENCIEDLEERVNLSIEVGNPCNESLMFFTSEGDRLMVLQDGSLLIIDSKNKSFEVESSYCLDTEVASGKLFALVCISSIQDHLGVSRTILYACFMIVSIPCLCIVSFLHLAVRELRSVHGLSLGVMSACLAVGFFLHTIAQISDYYKSGLGYAVQFFMLSYFCWLLHLCCNVVLHVWYYLPHKILITRTIRYLHFIGYATISFLIPLFLVLLTAYKGLPGMPSYFFQGLTESIRESQRYFIPPVTIALFLSFCLLVVSFFGFKNLEQRLVIPAVIYQPVSVTAHSQVPEASVDQEGYQEIKKDAKCICCLFVIIIIAWTLEVVTFYSPGPDDYIAFMEIINGLQGVFILMIFIVIRRRRNAIVRWWHDRGSHEVTPTEMTIIRPHNANGGEKL